MERLSRRRGQGLPRSAGPPSGVRDLSDLPLLMNLEQETLAGCVGR